MNDSLTRRIWDVDQFVLNPLDAMLLTEPAYCISCTNEVTFSRTAFEVVFFKDGTIFKEAVHCCTECAKVMLLNLRFGPHAADDMLRLAPMVFDKIQGTAEGSRRYRGTRVNKVNGEVMYGGKS